MKHLQGRARGIEKKTSVGALEGPWQGQRDDKPRRQNARAVEGRGKKRKEKKEKRDVNVSFAWTRGLRD